MTEPKTYYEVFQLSRYGNFLPDTQPEEPDADDDLFDRKNIDHGIQFN